VNADDGRPPILPAERYSPRPLTAGERWTVEALSELRRSRYTPTAWARFLATSFERARENRGSRPEMARQARRWGALGAAGWLAACRLSRTMPHAALPRKAGLLWWTAIWQMLDWHLGMAEGGNGVARRRLSSADGVTLVRFWLVPGLWGMRRSPVALPGLIAIRMTSLRRLPRRSLNQVPSSSRARPAPAPQLALRKPPRRFSQPRNGCPRVHRDSVTQ
jgi:hypothetical protein